MGGCVGDAGPFVPARAVAGCLVPFRAVPGAGWQGECLRVVDPGSGAQGAWRILVRRVADPGAAGGGSWCGGWRILVQVHKAGAFAQRPG